MAENQKPCEDDMAHPDGVRGGSAAVGTSAGLVDGQVLLPAFATLTAGGLMVDASAIVGDAFSQFAERIFSAAALFRGLDYDCFQRLVHGAADGPRGRVRLADAVAPFAADRRGLYKGIKISSDGQRAEYMFEPVTLEKTVEEPVYGEGADGGRVVVGQAVKTVAVPAKLDFDEFVADMWTKGLRFGIDAAAVREVIARGETRRLEVARGLPPTAGSDATIVELTEALHRSDAPRILPDGRMDLRHFKNRFPQIAAEQPLLRKVPRVLGKPGRRVDGELVEPELPADFDLNLLAGPGTRIEGRPGGDCIVSVADGFLNLDEASNQVSVTEKIVSHEGVSARTTGDLVLSGDDFEEHGEVQEKRVVEGKNMTFRADVFGEVRSHGGRILFAGNLSGGRAASALGSIQVDGRMTWALAEAIGGEIRLKHAEGSTIVGSRVFVDEAVYCQILAEEVVVGRSEGSAIAGRVVRVGSADARRQAETIVTMLVPDLAGFDKRAAEIEREQADADRVIQARVAQLDGLRGAPEVANFLALDARIRKGEVRLNPSQEATWRLTVARFAPLVRRLADMEREIQAQREERGRLDEDLAELAGERQRLMAGIACDIGEVAGDTLVRLKAYQPDADLLAGEQGERLRAGLRDCGTPADRLFWGESGTFAWKFQP